jgi:hypothetical protein
MNYAPAIWAIAASFVLLSTTQFTTAQVQGRDSFYNAKTVTIVVGYSAGGGYDQYSRLVARHLGRHIPDNPCVVVRNMPAAKLVDATMKYAHRLSLIAPEALVAAKLAINRGLYAGGFRNALNAGLEVLAPLYAATTEVGAKFDEIKAEHGLKAALAWRGYLQERRRWAYSL